jgi:hypothetical protein
VICSRVRPLVSGRKPNTAATQSGVL